MIDGLRWNSSKGQWWNDVSDSAPVNNQATVKADSQDDMVDGTFDYLAKASEASDKDGEFDFTEWNAKKLVWEMGNWRSLASIRNAIYKFQKNTGKTYMTLSSGPRISKSQEEIKKAAKKKAADNNWMRFEMSD